MGDNHSKPIANASTENRIQKPPVSHILDLNLKSELCSKGVVLAHFCT